MKHSRRKHDHDLIDSSVSVSQPLVFPTAFEGLARAFHFDKAATARLVALGLNFKQLEPAYPLATFLAALDVAADTLGDLGTPATRYRLLGRAYVKGWVGTASGLAMVTVGRLLGPRRLLLRMGKAFRTSANYVEVTVHSESARALELVVKSDDTFVPQLPADCGRLIDYRHGLLEGTVEQYGLKDSVDISERDDARAMARYLLKW